MGAKLTDTNPHLRDPLLRQRAVLKSVASSSAIEGIHAPFRKGAAPLVAKPDLKPAKKR